jgi:GNAT superfamily N-acetyltransferase
MGTDGTTGAPEGLVIRRANAHDLGRAVELLVLGAVPGGPQENPGDLGPYAAALRDVEGTEGTVLVAELDGEVIGVCQLIVFRHLQASGGRCAELESVHVHPDHRGSGVGRALVCDAVERARTLGCYRVQLTSRSGAPRRAPLLRGAGVRAHPRRFQDAPGLTAPAGAVSHSARHPSGLSA